MSQEAFPKIEGNIEVSVVDDRIIIAADPKGLKSLANTLLFLANVNQSRVPNMPDGERYHTHLYPSYQLSVNSQETEIGRLDAKGTGEFPVNYKPGSYAK
jgi:hypothetical protein